MTAPSPQPTRRQRFVGIAILSFGIGYVGCLFRTAAQSEAERSAWFISVHVVRGLCGRANFIGPVKIPEAGTPVTFEGEIINCQLTSSPFIWKTSPNGVPMTCVDLAKRDVFFACSSGTTWDGRRIFIFGGEDRPRASRDHDVDWKSQTMK